jgi:hypothetical protein
MEPPMLEARGTHWASTQIVNKKIAQSQPGLLGLQTANNPSDISNPRSMPPDQIEKLVEKREFKYFLRL